MAATSLIPLIFLITGCLGRAPVQRTQGAAAIAYRSPSGTAGVAAYSFQTDPNRLPPGAASPQPPALVYPQPAPRSNAGPSKSIGGTYPQTSTIRSSQDTRRYEAPAPSLPQGAARPLQPAPVGSPAARSLTQPQVGSSSVNQGSAPLPVQAGRSLPSSQRAPPPAALPRGAAPPVPAALPRGAASPQQNPPQSQVAQRVNLPYGAALPPPPMRGAPLPAPPPLSHIGPAPLPPGAARRQPQASVNNNQRLFSSVGVQRPLSYQELVAKQQAEIEYKNNQRLFSSVGVQRPLSYQELVAKQQAEIEYKNNQRLFSSVGVKRPLSYLELVAKQQAEIEYQNRLIVASSSSMHNARPQPVVTFFPALPPPLAMAPAPAQYQQTASIRSQEPVYDQFTQPVEATFRLDAARDLDCETIPEVRSLNVDVYHPMGCDDDICPKGKVCRTISSVGMCCPPSVTGDVITSKGRLSRAEYWGFGWK